MENKNVVKPTSLFSIFAIIDTLLLWRCTTYEQKFKRRVGNYG